MPPSKLNPALGADADAAELALVRAIQGGDPSAWSELLSRYQDRLYAVCLRTVGDADAAADLTQDSMVKIIQGLGGYDGRSKLSTWMIRVTLNTCLSYLRGQRLRRHASLDTAGEKGGRGFGSGWDRSGELSPSAGVEQGEARRRVAGALGSLGVEQRTILVLRDVQGLEYEQIAEVLGVAVGTVKSRLFRARVALREAVEGK